MTETKFKTLRHIETVRNYLNAVIKELMNRQEQHDQSKLQEPEAEVFEEVTNKLRGMTYGSDEYKEQLKLMGPALQHHYDNNRHHPEYGDGTLKWMTLVDLIEMICDWKAATLRHDNGDLHKSIQINAERFKYGQELAQIFWNTELWLENREVYHHAEES